MFSSLTCYCLAAKFMGVKAREINKRIERVGGECVRQEGSHRRYKLTRDGQTVFATVPQHGSHDIRIGTLKTIEKQLAPILGKGWLTK